MNAILGKVDAGSGGVAEAALARHFAHPRRVLGEYIASLSAMALFGLTREEARQLLARALPVMLHHCSMLPASFTAWPAEFDELDGDASLRSSRDFARASRDLNGDKGSSRQTPPLDNDDYATISSSV